MQGLGFGVYRETLPLSDLEVDVEVDAVEERHPQHQQRPGLQGDDFSRPALRHGSLNSLFHVT